MAEQVSAEGEEPVSQITPPGLKDGRVVVVVAVPYDGGERVGVAPVILEAPGRPTRTVMQAEKQRSHVHRTADRKRAERKRGQTPAGSCSPPADGLLSVWPAYLLVSSYSTRRKAASGLIPRLTMAVRMKPTDRPLIAPRLLARAWSRAVTWASGGR